MKHHPKDRTGWLFEGFEAPPLVPRHIIREEPTKYRVAIFLNLPTARPRIPAQRPATFGELPGVSDRANNSSVRHYPMIRPYRKTI